MGDKVLPPMPKLRPRPGLGTLSSELPPPLKKRRVVQPQPQHNAPIAQEEADEMVAKKSPSQNQCSDIEIIEVDSKTSRLLTKNECGRGGGRKRNSGSMIHSIPKFSQVAPKGGKISEVQKVLQSRLLSKQLSRQKQPCPVQSSLSSQSKVPKQVIQKEYPATFMLKSIHDKASKAQIQTPKPLPIINNNQTRKRNRKPDKSSICHVVPEVSEVICHDDNQHNDVDDQEEEEEEEESIPSPLKQILDGVGKSKPEVTITPALKTTTIMSPEDYKQNGLPSGYIFWPTANVFVHPSMVQSHWYNGHSRKAVASSQDVTIEKSSLGGKNFKIQPSPQPQKTTSPAENLEYQTTTENKSEQKNQNVEVSICKFKFTGGAKPLLEEKKMMSVDSGGHFRYYSDVAKGSLKGKETISKEVMANNASHIVTDKFTSLTAEKLNKKTPQSQNSKSKKDYNTDHLYRPIKPKPHSGL